MLYQGSTPIAATTQHGIQHGVNGNDPITPESIGAAVDPKYSVATLYSSAWDNSTLTQTVNIIGVSANETDQLITPTPAKSSQTSYHEAGIICTGQDTNSLTFTANSIPAEDLIVYIVIQDLRVNWENELVDFSYTENSDGTCTINDWKGTLKGASSTSLVIPDNDKIIL